MPKKKSPGRSADSRRQMGRKREGALVPVPPPRLELPERYDTLLAELKKRIAAERLRVVLAANSAMVTLYWDIGKAILARQAKEGWGAKVIDRLSNDLRGAFPDMSGLSARNLKYMRAFAEAWPDRAIVQEALAQITWYHNLALLENLDSSESRLWYAKKTIENGWSRNLLVMQISGGAHLRQGKAITNFASAMPPLDSDMAAQVFKDPYLFDFLGTADLRREREVEDALIDHVEKFLLEMGQGFAFVGRSVPLEVGDQDFVIDLLFYHLRLRCYVVIELKAVRFEPAFVGQLNLYLAAVDDLLRHPDDKPTIGLLLCRGKSQMVVEYALRGFKQPLGVANWAAEITDRLPPELEGSLPTVAQLEAELGEEVMKSGGEKKKAKVAKLRSKSRKKKA